MKPGPGKNHSTDRRSAPHRTQKKPGGETNSGISAGSARIRVPGPGFSYRILAQVVLRGAVSTDVLMKLLKKKRGKVDQLCRQLAEAGKIRHVKTHSGYRWMPAYPPDIDKAIEKFLYGPARVGKTHALVSAIIEGSNNV